MHKDLYGSQLLELSSYPFHRTKNSMSMMIITMSIELRTLVRFVEQHQSDWHGEDQIRRDADYECAFDLLATNQIFNDANRLLMSYHLIRSFMFGKFFIGYSVISASFSTRWRWSVWSWFSWAAIKSVCCLDIHSSVLSDSGVSLESSVLSIGVRMWDDRRIE